jgi:hypothetical protein
VSAIAWTTSYAVRISALLNQLWQARAVESATSLLELVASLRTYRAARREFLAFLGCKKSNRDPLAEFAERIAQAVLGGSLATSRVQTGHDLVTENGETVQVKYLANPEGTWVNEHPVDFRGGCDRYALLIVEALDAKALVVFSREGLAGACSELGKRHPNQDLTLQFTRANYREIATKPERFEPFGVTLVQL